MIAIVCVFFLGNPVDFNSTGPTLWHMYISCWKPKLKTSFIHQSMVFRKVGKIKASTLDLKSRNSWVLYYVTVKFRNVLNFQCFISYNFILKLNQTCTLVRKTSFLSCQVCSYKRRSSVCIFHKLSQIWWWKIRWSYEINKRRLLYLILSISDKLNTGNVLIKVIFLIFIIFF